ncbi:MAG: hypothetical protein FD123_1425, partial [Bacteroidetes bacterium]
IVIVVVAVHPAESVTVQMYVPAQSAVAFGTVCAGTVFQLYA